MSASLFVSNVPLRKPTTPPVSPDFLRTGDAKSESNGHLTDSTVSWCNYCSQQANFRCVRCRDAFYCSVQCQTQDWTAHRHTCTASSPVSSVIKYPTESQGSAVMGKAVTTLQPKLNVSDDSTAQPTISHQKTYLKDLKPNSITKGTEIKGLVAEFRSPSRFFVQSLDPQVTENLKSITTELTKAASDGPPSTSYTPNQGEVCAVKLALDGNWFRGLVQSVSANQKPATVLYIDIGNEETVTDRLFLIKPLPVSLQVMPPCVLQCRLSGVVPVAGSWTRDCCMAVKQLLNAKYFPVTVIDASDNGHVFTVDIELSAFGKRLSTFLIDQGYAAPAKVSKKTEPDINSLVSASLDNFKRLSIGKDENLGARPPKPLTLCVGDTFSAMITNLQSPHNMICQKFENAAAIHEHQCMLREHCSQIPANHNFRPAPGTMCCSHFSEDKQWYRAKVLAYSSEEHVCVGYIDFGPSEEVELSRLRPISRALLALPLQAVPCALAGVGPVEECWSEDCITLLRQAVCNRQLRVKILGKRDGTALVSMMDEFGDPQADIAELLLTLGHACPQQLDADSQTHNGDSLVEETWADTQFVSCAASPEVPPPIWCYSEFPSDGQMVAVVANLVENPGDFYCYLHNPEDPHKMQNLMADLKQHCEAHNTPFRPRVGEPCCAMFSGDGVWYRAMIQSVFEVKAEVLFVDYGNSSQVDISHLRTITPQLLTLPIQAIHCCLAGMLPVGSAWSSETISRFQTLMGMSDLKVRVTSKVGDVYEVELESGGQSVTSTLQLEEQLATNAATRQENCSSSVSEAPETDVTPITKDAAPPLVPPITKDAARPLFHPSPRMQPRPLFHPSPRMQPTPCSTITKDAALPLVPPITKDAALPLVPPITKDAAPPLVPPITKDAAPPLVPPITKDAAPPLVPPITKDAAPPLVPPITKDAALPLVPPITKDAALPLVPPITKDAALPLVPPITKDAAPPLVPPITKDAALPFVPPIAKDAALPLVPPITKDAAPPLVPPIAKDAALPLVPPIAKDAALPLVPPIAKDAALPLVPPITKDAALPLVPPIAKDAALPLVPPITKDAAPPLVPPITKDAAPPLVLPITKDAAPPLVPPITKDAALPLVPPITKDAAPPLVPPIAKDAAPPLAVTLPPDVPAGCFPVDWRAGELPQNETFQPRVAAIISPSLFYLHTTKMGVEELQRMMMDLEVYGSTNQDSCLSQTPAVGAACCARSSGDKNWYRAVVLEAGESEVTVLYADHGNTETLPYTSILPIPSHLLKVPFYITRCALTGSYEGKELFPLPAEELALFKTLLSEDVSATVDYSDNLIHLLSVTLPAHRGGGQLNTFTLNRLQPQTTTPPRTDQALEPQHTDASASGASQMASATPVELEQPTGNTDGTADATGTMPDAAVVNDNAAQKVADQITAPHSPHTQSNGVEKQQDVCCCVEMKTKMAHLEQMLELLLTRMEK